LFLSNNSLAESIEEFEVRAAEGDNVAQYGLVESYYYFEGVEQDYKEGIKWY
jgi:uncharacterized protein